MSTTNISPDATSRRLSSSTQTVLSVLAALNEGKGSKAVDWFDDHFTFIDYALGLEFTDKKRLIEFFRKSRELFLDTAVRNDAIFECGDNVIVEWTLFNDPYSHRRSHGVPNSNSFSEYVDRTC